MQRGLTDAELLEAGVAMAEEDEPPEADAAADAPLPSEGTRLRRVAGEALAELLPLLLVRFFFLLLIASNSVTVALLFTRLGLRVESPG